MTPIKRYAGAASAAAMLALSLTACGGGAPGDASKDEFCEAFNSQYDFFKDFDAEASPEEQADAWVKGFNDYADKLEEVGTPEDISDEEREGFEITVEELGDLDADEVQKAIEDGDEEFAEISKDDEEKANAFNEYGTEKCGGPDLGLEEEQE